MSRHPVFSCDIIMLPFPRGQQTGHESISDALTKRILKLLKNHDAYEDRERHSLLPDHKFPEIRWDEKTMSENLVTMSDAAIRRKFQLLSNQRNQQKREVCRQCYQTGKRGYPFGIKFFYEGTEEWPASIPPNGAEAEKGCIGCGWYDFEKWREILIKVKKSNQ